jgi:hypothetical protein
MSTRSVVRTVQVVLLASLLLGRARAADAPPPTSRAAFGAEVDLLPVVLSAVEGQLGGGINVWAGRDRVRLRAVGTYLAFPEGALTPSGFQDRRLTVAAGIVDVFFQPGFSGPWLGTGLEYWWNEIASPAGPGTASWSSWVVTLGGGFVWKFWRGVYLNPWAAGHLLLSQPEVSLHGATWKPQRLTGEVSLKVGCQF